MEYICNNCKEIFSEPETMTGCYESDYGVSGMFPNSNYYTVDVCPFCGSTDIDDYCYEDYEYEEMDD